MKDVTPQNVEENRKRDESERHKEAKLNKPESKFDSFLNNKYLFWFGLISWAYLLYKYVF
jgi:hypothetical protein